ncbi:MAG: 3-oxoacyl-ACP synthase [Campylobacteraceae bacterium 4484_4]|nr:MAG: 3-oxoacyl-ACP synthase [Campylobacteraceae bacterium 4484_4]
MYASLKSIGAYVPPKKMTNEDFEKIVDTTDEWILQRTGIKTRYIAEKDQVTSDLAVEASKTAIERAGLNPEEIDMIVCATITPDYFCMPSTACVIADKLGIKNATAFDISAACSGFVYALSIAKAFVESGMKKNILIIGAEKLSSIVDYTDRTTCVLFGDGAGAAIIGVTEERSLAVLDVKTSSDGEYQDFLITPGGGSKYPCSHETVDQHLQFLKMKGNETFKLAVNTLTKDVKEILDENGMDASHIDWFVPHQANFRIIDAVARKLKFDAQKTVLTVSDYGNTSAASIPMAINRWYEEGKIKHGDLMLLDTFGGGLTWGSALVHFAL